MTPGLFHERKTNRNVNERKKKIKDTIEVLTEKKERINI